MIPIASVFTKIHITKGVVRQISKNSVSEHSLKVNISKGHKHLWKLDDSTFIKIFHYIFQWKCPGKWFS